MRLLGPRRKYWLLAWVSIAQELVVILTLTLVNPNWRGTILFSDWIEGDF